MAHLRKRYLTDFLLRDLKWSPAVAVFGMRQVGKTTLVNQLTEELGGTYETFDRESTAEGARRMPIQFCDRSMLLTIDEAQKVPSIFPAIKDIIGTHRRPMQFLLTGSVRFTLRKDIRESLTGRVILRELLPFSYSEIAEAAPNRLPVAALIRLAENPDAKKNQRDFKSYFTQKKLPTENEILRHCMTGGLPIPCFTHDAERRRAWFEAYTETLLTRDIALADETLAALPLHQAKAFLQVLANAQGTEISNLDLATRSGLRPLQTKRLMSALEALSIIDRIPSEVLSAKTIKKPRVEWKDVGLRNHVAMDKPKNLSDFSWPLTHLTIGQQFRSQLQALNHIPQWSFYKSRDGGTIPWIIRSHSHTIGCHYIPDETPKPFDYRTLKHFLEKNKNSIGIIFGAPRARVVCLGPRLWLVPWTVIF